MRKAVLNILTLLAGLCLLGALTGCGGLNVYPVHSQLPMGAFNPDLQPGQLPSVGSNPAVALTPGSQDIRGQVNGPTRLGIPPISIPQPIGRDGQIFHNSLVDRLAPTGLPKDFAFELVNQSFTVTNAGIQDSLARLTVTFTYRVNAINLDGTKTFAFGDSLRSSHDYVAANIGSQFVDDVRTDNARRVAIAQMADMVAIALELQFARLNRQAL